ncbi:hypothetical protein ABSY27_20005 [Escherichia coli]|jgi:hypothetical protein|uniref:hypothetical protein n=1 Tax=Escherichia coli TaxID=562 RepID=UPI000BDEEE32|nr:hypothetical protein [Escherichia coli]EHD3418373.1 hypothetical protein [Escherichia coli O167]EAC1934105.1 hypothetical protein [Escherichia coli]EFE3141410.1 hypothetical protein [Escherichia coli]EKK1499429.1 hypothetical protein [Escherichia coli]HAM5555874.1 hypothetical protein [Escherichia coli]
MKSEGLTPAQLAERNAEYVTEISRLEKERAALAAENAAMHETIEAVRSVADNSSGIAGWHLNGDIATWEEILPEINDIETPATDAFLAEVRAQGLEMFAQKCNSKSEQSLASDIRDNWKLLGEHATDFADELRRGISK